MKLLSREVINSCFSKASRPTAAFITVAGLFSDFVKPYANFIPYFLLASAILALVIWFPYFIGRRSGQGHIADQIFQSRLAPAFGVAVLSFLFWLIMLPVFWLTPKDGVLASSIPGISGMQDKMLGRFDRLESKMDNRFDEVLDKLDSLDTNSGIVRNPKTSADYYHNARIYELTGNTFGARQSYEHYFEADLHYLDPYLSYAQIIKSMEGPSSAQEMLGQLKAKHPTNPAIHLAFALANKEPEGRKFLLDNVRRKFPNYGPVFFYIVKFNSVETEGHQTLADEERSTKALLKLDSLELTEGFSKYFIDKQLLAENLESIKLMRPNQKRSLSSIDFHFSIEGLDLVHIDILPAEMATKVFFRIDQEGEFKSTGNSSVLIQSQPYPETSIQKTLALGKHKIEAKYLDVKGEESATEIFQFEVRSVNISFPNNKYVRSEKEVEYDIRVNLYKVKIEGSDLQYSIDSEAFDKHLQVDNDLLIITLTNPSTGNHSVSARIKFPGGKLSDPSRLEFTIQP